MVDIRNKRTYINNRPREVLGSISYIFDKNVRPTFDCGSYRTSPHAQDDNKSGFASVVNIHNKRTYINNRAREVLASISYISDKNVRSTFDCGSYRNSPHAQDENKTTKSGVK